ncbi:uncharacterized protein LOC123214987 [Mangifera indica]|uniref:uncharacterized protein LOC123214987 n=1 Tax=Mangifera indica TaxID=29780 RepID=UPI001CFA0DD5|nr:uncharacterized protein LOC123214987 [Mangifera indica]
MERQRTCSLFIYGFVLTTVLYFIPVSLAARLLYSPPQNSPVGEADEHGQSKSGAKPSISDHSGSAIGESPPSVPPPPSISVSEATRNGTKPVFSCGRGRPYASCLPQRPTSSPREPVGFYNRGASP